MDKPEQIYGDSNDRVSAQEFIFKFNWVCDELTRLSRHNDMLTILLLANGIATVGLIWHIFKA